MTLHLNIEGALRAFTPIKTFRALHGLPPDFGVAHFEPKEFAGLGRIDGAGAELGAVRAATLDAIPAALPPAVWVDAITGLSAAFEGALIAVNDRIGLRDVEIGFAASGFADMCHAYAFALLRAHATKGTAPSFAAVYGEWLSSTARVSQRRHEYQHRGAVWQVQIVNHAYGRAGLIVDMGAETSCVEDGALGCPAEGYMAGLLAEVCAQMAAGIIP